MTLLLTLLLACGGAEEAPAPAPEADAPAKEAPAEEAPADDKEEAPEAGAAPDKVNLNTGTDEQFLEKMPDLGKKMLHEFEEYRPYKSVRQFKKEMSKYVPEDTIDGYLEHAYVPIAYNSCDAPTLMQIPGLDKPKSKALIDGRPYDTPDLFVAALGEQLGTDASAYQAWLTE